MRLFTRTVPLTGPPAEVMSHSSEMAAFVSKATGLDVGLWSVQFGAPLGTVVYSARVEGLAHLGEITATLMGDSKYHTLLAKGTDYVSGPVVDSLATPLHGGEGDAPPVGTVVMGTQAIVAGGKYAQAAGWGVEMAILSEQVTGLPVGFFMDAFGTFGGVGWLSGAPDAATAEAAGDKLNADSGYLDKLGDVGDLFIPGSGNRTMATRIA